MMKVLTTLSIKMTDTYKVKCSSGFQRSESEKKPSEEPAQMVTPTSFMFIHKMKMIKPF